MANDVEARELIVQIVHELFAAGHLTATGGNVSNRSSDGETLWITPSGLYKGGLTAESLVRIRADGSVVEGVNEPSIEYRMHFRAYDARPPLGARYLTEFWVIGHCRKTSLNCLSSLRDPFRRAKGVRIGASGTSEK